MSSLVSCQVEYSPYRKAAYSLRNVSIFLYRLKNEWSVFCSLSTLSQSRLSPIGSHGLELENPALLRISEFQRIGVRYLSRASIPAPPAKLSCL